jgi:DNA-binding transcriptional MocR family regulator
MAPDRVLYLGTLSKIFAPGIRIGWVCGPTAIVERLLLLKEAADLSQSNLTQYVAEHWLRTQPWHDQVLAYREVYRERCDALLTALSEEMPPGCEWSAPTGGFFVWARLPEGLDSGELLPKAIGERVAYVPGRGFFADGTGGRHLRLSFCYPTPARIREGVRRLAEVVRAEIELVDAVYGRPPA